jgi:hypothetical protein
MIKLLSFVVDFVSPITSISSSVSNTISLAENIKDRRREEAIAQVVEVVTANGEPGETLFKKIRKWSMAHSNFIS